ncbi:hypothetical protein LTR84_005491 [Exophiala bonariae]|uniref:C2H2-type domain-containing protein n=1 Tax=Exophiala bonariae TaxID=1690606 RepID=A0AAV9N4A1_9EURO|nr:hypothetical protein LTR84_005491 [Exophiala bonariae]
MKIKCTYANCFKHFDTKKAMIAHKKRDPDHSYCERCDVDCDDDMLYFIHQLGSQAHNCCPVCGTEFHSVAARDIHVEQMHRQSQKLECVGCNSRFTSAASLMFHIEQDECRVIRQSDFKIQRAERQLEKEVWESANDPSAFGLPLIATRHQSQSQGTTAGNLLDDEPTSRPVRSLQNAIGGPISASSLQQFPPLNSTGITTASGSHSHTAPVGPHDLIDLDSAIVDMKQLRISQAALQRNIGALEGTTKASYKVEAWLNSNDPSSKPPQDDDKEIASLYDKKSPAVDEVTKPEPTVTLSSINENHNHIVTLPASSVLSATTSMTDVERFWDAVQQQYECPAYRCKRKFNRARDFREHLLSPVHAGGEVICPTCLKRFRTTASWVAHTESASKKCDIRNSANFNTVMREITGGLLSTSGNMDDGTTPNFVAPRNNIHW